MIPNYFFFFIFMFLFNSCSTNGDNVSETYIVRLDHYQQTAVGVGAMLVYRIQKDEMIGGDTWQFFYEPIARFEYEPGFIYDLKIRAETVVNPPADGSSVSYYLESVISKIRAPDNVTFSIRLKAEDLGENFVTGSENLGFKILDKISITCRSSCAELATSLNDKPNVNGIFKHSGNSEIELVEILTP